MCMEYVHKKTRKVEYGFKLMYPRGDGLWNGQFFGTRYKEGREYVSNERNAVSLPYGKWGIRAMDGSLYPYGFHAFVEPIRLRKDSRLRLVKVKLENVVASGANMYYSGADRSNPKKQCVVAQKMTILGEATSGGNLKRKKKR